MQKCKKTTHKAYRVSRQAECETRNQGKGTGRNPKSKDPMRSIKQLNKTKNTWKTARSPQDDARTKVHEVPRPTDKDGRDHTDLNTQGGAG